MNYLFQLPVSIMGLHILRGRLSHILMVVMNAPARRVQSSVAKTFVIHVSRILAYERNCIFIPPPSQNAVGDVVCNVGVTTWLVGMYNKDCVPVLNSLQGHNVVLTKCNV